MTNIKRLIPDSCYWLTIFMPISIVLGRGVADANLTLVSLLFFTLCVLKKDLNVIKERWFLISITLWSYLIIRSIFSEDIILALKKSIPFIRFPLFALCLHTLISKYENANKNLLLSITIAVGFLVVDGYIQFFTGTDLFGHTIYKEQGGYERLTGPFSKKVLGATIAVLSMPLIATLFYKISQKQKLLFPIISCCAIYLIVFLSNERSALIQTTTGIVALIILLSPGNKKILIIGPIIATILLITLYTSNLHEIIHRQFYSIIETAKNYSDSPYGKLWNAGIEIGLNNWIFGVGPMHFEYYCNEIVDFCRYHPHNIYIEMFAETGIIGLSIFLYLFLTIAKMFFNNYSQYKKIGPLIQPLALGCFIAIVMKLLPIPSSGFFKNWYAAPLWLMIGWLLCLGNTKSEKKKI